VLHKMLWIISRLTTRCRLVIIASRGVGYPLLLKDPQLPNFGAQAPCVGVEAKDVLGGTTARRRLLGLGHGLDQSRVLVWVSAGGCGNGLPQAELRLDRHVDEGHP